jgi:hypothetical protein
MRTHGSLLPTIATLTLAAGLGLAACGSSGGNGTSDANAKPDQPAPHSSQFTNGVFDTLPRLTRMRAIGPASRKDGVTTRTYRVASEPARHAIETYGQQLRQSSQPWRVVQDAQQVGENTYESVWQRNEYTLVVTASPAPTLQDGAEAIGVTQLSLQLYDPGTTASTLAPG